jgi:formylglycine-generating enzyme required for sulfatase activity
VKLAALGLPLSVALTPLALRASDLRVETGRVDRTASGGIRVTAIAGWKNAWRNQRNHDAVWLFAKARPQQGGPWVHARVVSAAMQLRAPTMQSHSPRMSCEVSADRVGAFCGPETTYRGDIVGEVTLELDPASLPERMRGAELQASIHGIEMVFIPGGPFTVGDTDPRSIERAAFFQSDASGAPVGRYRVTSEAAIAVGPTQNALYYKTRYPQYEGDQKGPIPAEFPKGTRAFYVMKYEILQGQYADFLNGIDYQGTFFRAPIAGVGYRDERGTIRLDGRRYVADSPNRPANWTSWDDGTAFADWAGLRPMTELEFTKAARGPADPVALDYPWGTSTKTRLLRRIGNDAELARGGDADESKLTDENREVFGASYYWVMDLAGSVWEKVVSVGHPAGRAFKGTHGDGRLREYGVATNADWPSGDHDASGTGGYGYRGGGFYEAERERSRAPAEHDLNPYSPVAWRSYAAWGGAPRSVAYGFRAARSADSSP